MSARTAVAVSDVSIVMVTFNSAADLRTSLAAALGQRGVSFDVVVVDNASADETCPIVEGFAPKVRLLRQDDNRGFAAAANIGIDATAGRYVLVLNPDCRLDPDFARVLVNWLDAHPDAGSASGRLLRGVGPGLEPNGLLDSAGIRMTVAGRHFDRGSGEPARGRYLLREEISGVTGAAAIFRRSALDSARISTGYFDADFFVYREDADLAWRLRKLGWTSWYVPDAVAWHRRHNLPDRRSRMSATVNRHSVKNRYLLRINNQTRGEFLWTFWPTILRDLVVLGGCLTVERPSLPAFQWLWTHRAELLKKRREISRLAEEPEVQARRAHAHARARLESGQSPLTPRRTAVADVEPLVSVCIPTFQGGRFLQEALRSALDQTYRNLEIIVVDGGSTDDTLAIAAATGDPRVQVLAGSPDGMVPNWNRSLREARGKYVKFLFQDDLLQPSCVDEMVRAMERHPSAGLAFCPRTVIVSDPEDPVAAVWMARNRDIHHALGTLHELNSGRSLVMAHADAHFAVNWIGEPSAVMVSREALVRVGTFNLMMHQLVDAEMWLRILYAYDACFIDRKLASFRLHSGAVTGSNLRLGQGWLDIPWAVEGLLRHPDLTESDRVRFRRRGLKASLVSVKGELGRLRRGHRLSLRAHAGDLAEYAAYRWKLATGRPPDLHGSL